MTIKDKLELLTPREVQVIKLVCREMTNEEIAEELELSPRTVETHRARIMNRLDIKSTIGLVYFAIKSRLIKVKIAK